MSLRTVLLITLSFLVFSPAFAQAQALDIVASPNLIDEKGRAGEIFEYDIQLVNQSGSKYDIYAVVDEIDKQEGEVAYDDPSELERSSSLVRWITFKRGVIELLPGGTTTVHLKIEVSSDAKPGKYYARIALPSGSNREAAQQGMAARSFTQIPISVEIGEDIINRADVKVFASDRNSYLMPPVILSFGFENEGNRQVVPEGRISIHNRRGQEVADIDANPQRTAVGAGQTWEQELEWRDIEKLGRYKARLQLEYGEKDKRDLQDTIYFWYLPWRWLLAIFLFSFILLVLIITLVFRRTFVAGYREEPVVSLAVRQGAHKSKKIVNLKK